MPQAILVRSLENYNMNIVFLGTTVNYGHLFVAANKKTELLAMGLKACGNNVSIHNGVLSVNSIISDERYEIPEIGNIINYAPKGHRFLEPFINFNRLKHDLSQLKDNTEKNILILLSPYLPIYEEYVYLGKKLGYKIVVISHEWLPTLQHRNGIERWLKKAYSASFGYGIDAILPISDFITEKVRHFKKPMFKTPILGDFQAPVLDRTRMSGFVYCGTVAYERAFMLLVEAYRTYCKRVAAPLPLTLVLSGKQSEIKRIKETISSNGKENITILSGLPYDELYQLYRTASGLLLPLDPDNIQDRARFSQKIAEYISTGTPLITSPVGEIPNYFTDKENAIFNPFTSEGFASSMEWITLNPGETDKIGKAGWQLGKKEFDYLHFGKRLNDFLKSL